MPFLVTHGCGDRQIPSADARRQYEAAVNGPDRELRILADRDGGVEHGGADTMLPAASTTADRVGRRL